LADKITISNDQLHYMVSLRKGVKWHDNRALTADDVVFTVGLLKDEATRTQIRGWDNISVKKKDDYTVEFSLSSVYTPFESALTFPILPKHILDGVAHDAIREHSFGNNPVGSGPFEFRLTQETEAAGKRIVHLAANDRYYNGKSKVARVQLLAAPDEATILSALATNEVNAASGITQESLHRVPGRYDIQTQPIQSGVYALLNNDSDILSDRAVRRALQRATNIEEIRKKVGGDVPALSLPYTDLFMEEEVAPKVPAYDQKEAGKLLDDAGWKLEGGVRKKDGKELRITVVTAKSVDYERALETLIGQWRRVGVRVSERIIDAADPTQNFVQSVLQQRSYDVLLYQLTMGGDPDVFAYWHSSQAVARGLNLANYSSAISDDILSSARSSKRDDLRDAKHIAFARQWIEDAPAIGLYQSVTRTAVSHNVHGMSKDVVLVGPAQRYTQAPQWMVGDRTVYKTP
jgi:peptide/nickel transport system substrate-binding protein